MTRPMVKGGVWFGLGQGLCRTPGPTVSSRLCADTTGLGESRLSGPKACRTVDRPRTPWWHTREGDAAVPVCVARAGQGGRACMLVALAGHDGSHGCAAPGPARWRWCRSGVSRPPCCGLVRLHPRLWALFAGEGALGGGHTGPTSASLSTWKNQESLRVVAGSSLCGLGCRLEGPAVAHTCRGK